MKREMERKKMEMKRNNEIREMQKKLMEEKRKNMLKMQEERMKHNKLMMEQRRNQQKELMKEQHNRKMASLQNTNIPIKNNLEKISTEMYMEDSPANQEDNNEIKMDMNVMDADWRERHIVNKEMKKRELEKKRKIEEAKRKEQFDKDFAIAQKLITSLTTSGAEEYKKALNDNIAKLQAKNIILEEEIAKIPGFAEDIKNHKDNNNHADAAEILLAVSIDPIAAQIEYKKEKDLNKIKKICDKFNLEGDRCNNENLKLIVKKVEEKEEKLKQQEEHKKEMLEATKDLAVTRKIIRQLGPNMVLVDNEPKSAVDVIKEEPSLSPTQKKKLLEEHRIREKHLHGRSLWSQNHNYNPYFPKTHTTASIASGGGKNKKKYFYKIIKSNYKI